MRYTLIIAVTLFVTACSTQRQITKTLNKSLQASVLQDSALQHAHVGVSLFDVSQNKFIYNYQGNKYFVPASNTKLFSCYAALKYLGDSLPGISYWENDTALYIVPTGDPTLLHAEFNKQPVIDFLKNSSKSIYITDANW
jgi:D-alanyl-D-alanine carboxypeptidase/D-alanyl-D-alanine-endopeptidase (penicillin-binding protein 4)